MDAVGKIGWSVIVTEVPVRNRAFGMNMCVYCIGSMYSRENSNMVWV